MHRSPALLTLSGRGIQMITQLALVLIVPKVLLPEIYVEFSLVLPIALLGSTLVYGWLISAVYRHVHDLFQSDGQRRQTIFAYFLITGLPLLTAYVALFITTDWIYALVPMLLVAAGLKTGILRILNAAERYMQFLLANVAFAISLGVFILICAISSEVNLRSALVTYAVLDSVFALLGFWYIGIFQIPPVPRIDRAIVRRYFQYGMPVVVNSVAVWVISLSDRYILTMWEPTERIASYILGYQLSGSIITIPMTFLMAVVFPRVIAIDRESGEQEALKYTFKLLKMYIYSMLPIFIAGCAIVIPFKYYFYPDYEFNPYIMIVIVLAHVIFGLTHFYNKEFELNGKTLVITKGVGLGAISNVGLNLALIPFYGVMGAAIATLAAYCIAVYFIFKARTYKEQAI